MKIFSVGKTRPVTFSLGEGHDAIIRAAREQEAAEVTKRLWSKDVSLWPAGDAMQVAASLGWLDSPEKMHGEVDEIIAFAEEVKESGITDLLLLGMGGSSLAPEVMRQTYGDKKGWPRLRVLDSTDPDAIARIDKVIDPAKTLFIVSSKSGGTIETMSLLSHFFTKAGFKGSSFVTITDAGSSLEKLSNEKGFRRVFCNPADIGGRYSALSFFGLVPAALAGIDIKRLLRSAAVMNAECSQNVALQHNPGTFLGTVLATLAEQGRDKVTILASDEVKGFSLWLEQLIAESTGKSGKGLVPIVEEPKGNIESYGRDRVFVHIGTPFVDEHDMELIHYLEKDGQPIISIRIDDLFDLGGEFLRWELAVATAGVVMGINPFDQPDVESAKKQARAMLANEGLVTAAIARGSSIKGEGFTIHMGELAPVGSSSTDIATTPVEAVKEVLRFLKEGGYAGILSYLDPADIELRNVLSWMRKSIRDSRLTATQLGYGPRYLHSTGQLHKGGLDKGVFFLFYHSESVSADLAVPGTEFTFLGLESAQAVGDFAALQAKGKKAVLIDIAPPFAESLKAFCQSLKTALDED